MALKRYKKNLDYSYTYGIYPTIELLKKRPQQVESVLLHPSAQNSPGIGEIRQLCKKNQINFDVSPKAIQKLSVKENTYAIGVFKKYFTELIPNTNHLMLVNPGNMGNVGTVIRTMLAFDVKNLALIRPAVDIFDPKIVRSTMGALFEINYEYFGSVEEYRYKFSQNTLYPFALNGQNELSQATFDMPATLVFGNEGSGLDATFEEDTNSIYIKHSKSVDSLNLSVACALGLQQLYS